MATIQEIKTKLLNANALGRQNLTDKGIEIPESATTYEIMSKISEISGGGGGGGVVSEGNYAEAFNALYSASFMSAVNLERIDFYTANPFTTHNGFFRGTSKLKYVKGVNMSQSKNMGLMFSESGIEVIEEPLDISLVTATSNAFACDNLREIRFVPETIKRTLDFRRCSKLSAQSIQSIIDGLATVTATQTLKINSAIILTDEQKASITSKGWTLVQES